MPTLFRTILVSGVLVLAGTLGLESVATATPGSSLSRARQLARARVFRTNRGYRRSTLPLYRRDRLRTKRTRVLRQHVIIGNLQARRIMTANNISFEHQVQREILRRRLRYRDSRISAANIGAGATTGRWSPTDGESLRHLRRLQRHRRSLRLKRRIGVHFQGLRTSRAPRRRLGNQPSVRERRRASGASDRRGEFAPRRRISRDRHAAPKWKVWKR